MLQLLGLFGFVCLLGGCCAYFLLFLRRNKFETKLAYARAWTLSAVLDARLSETSRPICLLKAYQNVLRPFWAARDAYILIRVLGSGQLPPFGIFWIASCILTISAFLFLRFFDILALAINIAALLLGAVCLFLPPPLSVMARPPIPAAICGALTGSLTPLRDRTTAIHFSPPCGWNRRRRSPHGLSKVKWNPSAAGLINRCSLSAPQSIRRFESGYTTPVSVPAIDIMPDG